MTQQRPMAITMGDPAGIGPEIIAKLFAEGSPVPAVVVGDAGILRRAVALLGLTLEVVEIDAAADATGGAGRMEVIAVGSLPPDLPFGCIDARAGAAAFAYISRAIDEVQAGRLSAIVTAPINKAAMNAAGDRLSRAYRNPGRARPCTTDYAMMLANNELRVLLVSIHVSLADAIRAVTVENELRAIRLADLAGRQFGIERPRVAVAGLNPHAGESGMFGVEDDAIIVRRWRQREARG